MPIIIDLEQLKRQKEVEWQREITWTEFMEVTGLYPTTLAKLRSADPEKQSKRVDISTLEAICKFFKLPTGCVPFIKYIPDDLP